MEGGEAEARVRREHWRDLLADLWSNLMAEINTAVVCAPCRVISDRSDSVGVM